MELRRVVQPAYEPVSVDEAKLHCRIDGTDEDVYVASLIRSAREQVEDTLRRTLMQTTWELQLDTWPARVSSLPNAPLLSVTSMIYVDDEAADTTLSASDYVVNTGATPGRIVLKRTASWPGTTLRETGAIRIRYVAGYRTLDATLTGAPLTAEIAAARAAVPARAKQAVLLIVGHLYENREQVTMSAGTSPSVLPMGVDALLMPFRVIEF